MLQQLTTLRREQERLNLAVEVWRDLSRGIGSAWVQALSSVAEGTRTVAEAFKAMAQSILASMAEIASHKNFQCLFKLYLGILTSALTPSTRVNPTMYTSPIGPGLAGMPAQHGAGPINAPTLVLVGEGPTNSEWVLNNQQMQALMTSAVRSGTAQGGQGSPVSIHNYPDRATAEQGAAQQRALGNEAIVNAAKANLSQVETSSLLRTIRALQR